MIKRLFFLLILFKKVFSLHSKWNFIQNEDLPQGNEISDVIENYHGKAITSAISANSDKNAYKFEGS